MPIWRYINEFRLRDVEYVGILNISPNKRMRSRSNKDSHFYDVVAGKAFACKPQDRMASSADR